MVLASKTETLHNYRADSTINYLHGIAAYESIRDGADFIFSDINKAAERIDNVKKEKLLGTTELDIFPGIREFGLFDRSTNAWG